MTGWTDLLFIDFQVWFYVVFFIGIKANEKNGLPDDLISSCILPPFL